MHTMQITQASKKPREEEIIDDHQLKNKKQVKEVKEIKEIKAVPGLFYIENVMDMTDTIKKLDALQWTALSNSPNSRKVQHFGYKYNYNNSNTHEKGEDFPDFIDQLSKLLKAKCSQANLVDEGHIFNQCIVNNYEPGQGISKHIDVKTHGAVIGCYTLGSGATMVFRKDDQMEQVHVKKNSLYIMSGDARYKWTHEMPSRKSDMVNGKKVSRDRRISITFRSVA